jgi:hypothetical protein
MEITSRHREAEASFRRLVEDAGLEPPDAVTYEPESVTFFWNEPMVAVVVDLDGAEAPVVVNGREADRRSAQKMP